MNYYPSNSAFIELPVTKPQQQGCEFYLNNVWTLKSYLEMCDAMIVFPNKKQTEMQKKQPKTHSTITTCQGRERVNSSNNSIIFHI